MKSGPEVRSERGASLIAAIFLIVIVGFFGAIAGSLIGTQSSSALNETQSSQALYVAEGGDEFVQMALAQNLDWYRSATDPMVTPATALGAGNFAVNTYLPATLLRRRVTPASANIPVFTTARFPTSGYIQLDDDITGGGEFVQYTGVTATTFTGLTRNVTIGGIAGGAVGTFARATHVYPVTTLSAVLVTLGGACAATPSAAITIAAHSKVLPAGTITIDPEEITYSGSSTVGAVTTLSGVTRCVNGTSSAHAAGAPVTPLLADGLGAVNYEAFLVSTGSVGTAPLGTAVRVVQKTVQR
jgi:hypothetical protein